MRLSYLRNESDDFIAAVTGDDGTDSSDEDDDGTDSHYERPPVRQRSNTGSSVGRRLEEMEPVGREPTEGRNRRERELHEVCQSTEGSPLDEVHSSTEVRGDKEEASDADQPVQSKEGTVAQDPVSPEQARGGPYANAYKMWRNDASRWKTRAQLTSWPHWVYRQYDTYHLARRAAGE